MGTIWDRTTDFIADALPAILPFATLAFAATAIQSVTEGMISTASAPVSLALRAAVLALVLVALFARVAVVSLALGTLDATSRAADIARRRYIFVVGIHLATLVIGVVLALPAIGLVRYGGVSWQDMANLQPGAINAMPARVRVALGLYGLVAAVGAFWVFVRLSLAQAVAVADGGVLSALRQSFALTRGHAFKITGVLILLTIVSFVATKAVQTVFGSVLGLIADSSGPLSPGTVITAIAVALAATAFTLLSDVFFAKFYLAVRGNSAGFEIA